MLNRATWHFGIFVFQILFSLFLNRCTVLFFTVVTTGSSPFTSVLKASFEKNFLFDAVSDTANEQQQMNEEVDTD
jgi:hypothetical protein